MPPCLRSLVFQVTSPLYLQILKHIKNQTLQHFITAILIRMEGRFTELPNVRKLRARKC
jgi:hypothetical protein